MLKEKPALGRSTGFPIHAGGQPCKESDTTKHPELQPRDRLTGTLTIPNRTVDLSGEINALAAQQKQIAKRSATANYNARRLRMMARGVRP